MAKWTEEDKLRALAIVETSSASEASRQTGIPRGTILGWMQEWKSANGESINNQSTFPKRVREISDEAMAEAKEEVREYLVDKVKEWSNSIMQMSMKAAERAFEVVQHQPPDDISTVDLARWLHALVGAMDYGVKNHQLLEGKATSRAEGELKTTHEEKHTHIHTVEEYQSAFRNVLARQKAEPELVVEETVE